LLYEWTIENYTLGQILIVNYDELQESYKTRKSKRQKLKNQNNPESGWLIIDLLLKTIDSSYSNFLLNKKL